MKNTTFLIGFLLSFALAAGLVGFQNANPYMTNFPNDDYEALWSTVDSLEQEGLPRSAQEKVMLIYEKASQDKNTPQIVKALLYRSKYITQLEEDGLATTIQEMEKELAASEFPVRPLLHSILGELYQYYLDQNRWELEGRTSTGAKPGEDIQTWSIDQLLARAFMHFEQSVAFSDLETIPISKIQAITQGGKETANLRPTLFDFLAHRAIDFMMNDRSYVNQPSYRFYLDQEVAFADATTFSKANFDSPDTLSGHYQAVQLFQRLLRIRLADTDNIAALLDADNKRLKFAYENSVLTDKAMLYHDRLVTQIEQYQAIPLSTDYDYSLASLFQEKARQKGTFKGLSEEELLPKAHAVATAALERHPDSKGALNCREILREIEQTELSVEMEEVNLPDQSILALLRYRNLETVHFRLIRMNEQRKEKFGEVQRDDYDKTLSWLNGLSALRSWSTDLPEETDFRAHATEFALDGLEPGLYLLQASDQETFQSGHSGYLFFHVSGLGYWKRQLQESSDLQVVAFDRSTGNPKEGVRVELWERVYNSVFRSYKWKKKETLKTDDRGFATANTSADWSTHKLLLKEGNDTLHLDESFSTYYRTYQRQSTQMAHFYLDRSIYRPGQTVFFKAILLEKSPDGMPSILTNQSVQVTLRDANYQEAATLKLTSNSYGTVSGSFLAPATGLRGQMRLEASIGGQKAFRVEEYKRPKFAVSFDTPDQSYRLGETVSVKGTAEALAGYRVDGAKVSYRVVRRTSFPWWTPWRWRWYPPNTTETEIASGETTTDAEGAFQVAFTALPDRTVSKEQKPQFTYEVQVDVTDGAGETRSGSTTVNVGYLALKVALEVGHEMHADALKSIPIRSENLNGGFEPAEGTLVIEALKVPKNSYVTRYWSKPDRFLLDEKSFQKQFPHVPYQNEDVPETWEVRKEIANISFNTASEKAYSLANPLKPGVYKLTLKTQDRYGALVEEQKIVFLYHEDAKEPTQPVRMWTHLENSSAEPGEQVVMLAGTRSRTAPILFEIERDGRLVLSQWVSIEEVERIKYRIQEKDRGNIFFHISYAGDNRASVSTQLISVPWSNKQLEVDYLTFRDKLLPGQEEEWRIRLKGPDGERVAAEMVAALYDASLDQIAPHSWSFNVWPHQYRSSNSLSGPGYRSIGMSKLSVPRQEYFSILYREYAQLNWFGFSPYSYRYYDRVELGVAMEADAVMVQKAAPSAAPRAFDEAAPTGNAPPPEPGIEIAPPEEEPEPATDPVPVRTNLNETVFFFPDLLTDEEGNVEIRFTMNEALTKWNLFLFGHTTDLASVTDTKTVVTQKQLMVVPNAPRFFREGDEIEFSAKVVNLSEGTLNGNVELQLVNPLTTTPVYKWLDNPDFNTRIELLPGQSQGVAWRFKVPDIAEVPLIEHTVLAVAGNYSDAERSASPVVSNRMLVTETMPLPIRGNTSQVFTFDRLKNASSNTLSHQQYTLEFTSNPAWYAVQALPYLMEYPYECTEQIFSRYYANSLATSVANAHPKVKAVFEAWKDQPAMESNLTKNQELKSVLLEETPWVLAAQSEEAQKKNIGLLFDLTRMAEEQAGALEKLKNRQLPGGGFAWFDGGRDNWYISQYILEGLGHLHRLGVQDIAENPDTRRMVENAVRYVDERVVEYYDELKRSVEKAGGKMSDDHLSPIIVHYLYTRSFFLEQPTNQVTIEKGLESGKDELFVRLEGRIESVFPYFLEQAKSYWLNKGIYQEGMIGLTLYRRGDAVEMQKIARSLVERSLQHEELGRYWKYDRGYYWYQHPIETQALLIEFFDEAVQDAEMVNELKVWLLKNKQTTHWKTTKATAEAVYALLSSGENWLLADEPVALTLGGETAPESERWNAQVQAAQAGAEAGTGYFKTQFPGEAITPEMGTVSVQNPNPGIAWGAVYWQYFEQLDKITSFEETPLQLKKQYYRVTVGDRGEVLEPIAEEAPLQPGDKVRVRLELRVDRVMEYVHMKDMRASGLEPMATLSRYRWKGGLGFYESPGDVATNFFFSYLPKGTHVFEYDLRVVHRGDFSSGITSIQCMYAPEFTSHSEGIRMEVK